MTVEMVPWCDGKNQLTTTYRWYLATWAKRLSWSEVASSSAPPGTVSAGQWSTPLNGAWCIGI